MNSSIESSGTLSVLKAKHLHKSLQDQDLRQKCITLVAQTLNFGSIMLVLFDPVVTLGLSYLFTVRPPRSTTQLSCLASWCYGGGCGHCFSQPLFSACERNTIFISCLSPKLVDSCLSMQTVPGNIMVAPLIPEHWYFASLLKAAVYNHNQTTHLFLCCIVPDAVDVKKDWEVL